MNRPAYFPCVEMWRENRSFKHLNNALSRDYVDRHRLELPTLLAESGAKMRAHLIYGRWQEFDAKADINEFHKKKLR